MARGLTIPLGKQLSRQKFGWISKDPNAALDSEPGFISSYHEDMIRVFHRKVKEGG